MLDPFERLRCVQDVWLLVMSSTGSNVYVHDIYQHRVFLLPEGSCSRAAQVHGTGSGWTLDEDPYHFCCGRGDPGCGADVTQFPSVSYCISGHVWWKRVKTLFRQLGYTHFVQTRLQEMNECWKPCRYVGYSQHDGDNTQGIHKESELIRVDPLGRTPSKPFPVTACVLFVCGIFCKTCKHRRGEPPASTSWQKTHGISDKQTATSPGTSFDLVLAIAGVAAVLFAKEVVLVAYRELAANRPVLTPWHSLTLLAHQELKREREREACQIALPNGFADSEACARMNVVSGSHNSYTMLHAWP